MEAIGAFRKSEGAKSVAFRKAAKSTGSQLGSNEGIVAAPRGIKQIGPWTWSCVGWIDDLILISFQDET